jgi:hypothetical protein
MVGHCCGHHAARPITQVEGTENSPQTADEYQVSQRPGLAQGRAVTAGEK